MVSVPCTALFVMVYFPNYLFYLSFIATFAELFGNLRNE